MKKYSVVIWANDRLEPYFKSTSLLRYIFGLGLVDWGLERSRTHTTKYRITVEEVDNET
jgi:hypothetical protein